MKFSLALISSVLAATALAAPRAAPKGHGLAARTAARSAHRTKPINRVDGPATNGLANGTATQVEYSSNWAGAIITAPPAGSTFTSVTAEFTVPVPSIPEGGYGTEYSASAWVGIDGDTYENAILQTGADFTVDEFGGVSYDAWYEWYPDYAYDFDLEISSGDVLRVTVESSSSSSGTATIENLSTGQTVYQALSAPDFDSVLGGQNAEWIVEDFDSDGSEVAFADFGSLTFTSASAGYSTGGSEGPSAGTQIDIEQDEVLTSVSINGDSVTVTYL